MNPSLITSLPLCPFSPPICCCLFSSSPPYRMCLPAIPLPLLLGKKNLGQLLLLNEFYSDKLLPISLQRQLQSTQPSPQSGTPPHYDSDWLTRFTLASLESYWLELLSDPVIGWAAGGLVSVGWLLWCSGRSVCS